MKSQHFYQQFATVREELGERVGVHVFGDVDLSCASELEAAIDEAAASGAPVVVNFQHCSYMDSTGLTVLIRAVTKYGTNIEALVMKDSSIDHLMQITQFEDVLPITTVTRD